jgi:hypothetical protein
MGHARFCKYGPLRRTFIALMAATLSGTAGVADAGSWHWTDQLTITGSPVPSVTAGQAYSFTPSATDSAGRNLVFAIANMPS